MAKRYRQKSHITILGVFDTQYGSRTIFGFLTWKIPAQSKGFIQQYENESNKRIDGKRNNRYKIQYFCLLLGWAIWLTNIISRYVSWYIDFLTSCQRDSGAVFENKPLKISLMLLLFHVYTKQHLKCFKKYCKKNNIFFTFLKIFYHVAKRCSLFE